VSIASSFRTLRARRVYLLISIVLTSVYHLSRSSRQPDEAQQGTFEATFG
jgi:hypothetical protein